MGRFIGGLVLIAMGLFMGFVMAFGIAFGHGWSDEPVSYWGAADTLLVLFAGSLAFIPGALLVVSSVVESPRQRVGITSIIVGVTFSLVAWGLLGHDDALTGDYDLPVPSREYIFAALIGGIPLLIGAALLAYRPIRRAWSSSSRRTKSSPPPHAA